MIDASDTKLGEVMINQVKDLFPICRSLSGEGTRETLRYFKKILPQMKIHEVPSGTKAFDWEVPDEWNIKDAYVADEAGKRIIDFKQNNLHLVGYSLPQDRWMTFSELEPFLFTLPAQPEAIPYITSYYTKAWGFCLTYSQFLELKKFPDRKYHVVIDSKLAPGHLTYGELIIPGKTSDEILLSTYVCHPSMANNELSGPVVAINLAQWLLREERRYTYRILFLPETIGSIIYLSTHLAEMKKKTKAGFVLTCMGDDRTYSYIPSKIGNTLADRAALHTLKYFGKAYQKYSFLDRGSDERQYCAIGVDLPVCLITRSKYTTYPEYHTSLDNLDFVTAEGLLGGFKVIKKTLIHLENNRTYKNRIICEPQLGRHGLYPQFSTKNIVETVRNMKNFIAYCDGKLDLIAVADEIGVDAETLIDLIPKLIEAAILEEVL